MREKMIFKKCRRISLEKTRKKGEKELRRIKASENYEVDVAHLKNNEAKEREVE